MMFWLFNLGLWVLLSALFSGYETAYYSVNRVRLRTRVEEGSAAARRVEYFIRHPGITLSSIMIGINIANFYLNYSVQKLLTAAVPDLGEHLMMALTTILGTGIGLIFAEMVPKNVFRAHAERWTYSFSILIQWLLRVCLPVSWLLHWYSRALELLLQRPQQAAGERLDRETLRHIFSESHLEGALTDNQNRLICNIIQIQSVSVKDRMVPLASVRTVPHDVRPGQLRDMARQYAHDRFPVIGPDGDFQGVVGVVEALRPANGGLLQNAIKPLPRVEGDLGVDWVLDSLIQQRCPMALVTEHDKPVGIVTIRELIAQLTQTLPSAGALA